MFRVGVFTAVSVSKMPDLLVRLGCDPPPSQVEVDEAINQVCIHACFRLILDCLWITGIFLADITQEP